MAMPKWTKAPAPLVAQFGRAVEPLPDVQTRKMFGYPAVFTGGQMFAGLFQSSMMLRPSAEDRYAAALPPKRSGAAKTGPGKKRTQR